jgi:tetratricopeptide (TPR) repeat protein
MRSRTVKVDCKEATDFLAGLLTGTHALRLLVTGREAVKLSDAEQVLPLDEGMTEAEAETLFIARARLKRPKWQPGDGEQATLRRVLRLTERIPLGVELAAAWMDKRTLGEIADGIEATPLGALTGEQSRSRRTVQADRHQSLTRCLDWSFELLESPAQVGFACLGIFADSFSPEAVAAACGCDDAHVLLDRLQEAALVRRIEIAGRSRYTLHRFTRAYAADKLSSQPTAAAIRQRYVAYFCNLAVVHNNTNHLAYLAILDAEWRNVAAAAEVAAGLKDLESEGRLGKSLFDFLLLRRQYLVSEVSERLSERALVTARASGDHRGERSALNNLGIVYAAQGRWGAAESTYQQSLAICREIDDRWGEGQTLNKLGVLYQEQGRWEEAEAAHRQALAICREEYCGLGEEQALHNLGNVYQAQSRGGEAATAFRHCLAILRKSGRDRQGEGRILNSLGWVYEQWGQWAKAANRFQESLAIWREYGDRSGEGSALNNLGVVYGAQARWAEAEAVYQQSLAIRRECGDHRGEGQTLENLALLRKAQGDVTEALQFEREALRVLDTTEDEAAKAKAREWLAEWEQQGQSGAESAGG